MKVLPQCRKAYDCGNPPSDLERAVTLQRQATQADSAQKGWSRASAVLSPAALGGPCQEERAVLRPALSLQPPRLPCYCSLSCSSRYNVRWSGPEGATKVREHIWRRPLASFMGIVEKGLPARTWNSLWGKKVLEV